MNYYFSSFLCLIISILFEYKTHSEILMYFSDKLDLLKKMRDELFCFYFLFFVSIKYKREVLSPLFQMDEAPNEN